MSQEVGTTGARVERRPLEVRILELFDDGEPRTTREVATVLGIDESDAKSHLDALTDDRLATKTVGDGVRIWYASASDQPAEGAATRPAPDRETVEEHASEALSGVSVPGTSELMRSWRRDAIRAVAVHVAEAGPTTPAALREELYEGHAAGYDDPAEWWSMVSGGLSAIPGVEFGDGTVRFEPEALD